MLGGCARYVLRLIGWRVVPLPHDKPAKTVICVAPHTSNYDFLLGKLYAMAIGRKAGFLMKKEWFFFPLGLIFRSMGGVPIDRGRGKGSTVEQLLLYYALPGERYIAVTPEGTRRRTSRWKTGFYHIALRAGIPIELAMIDYKDKRVGIFEIFHPTGDMEADLRYIFSRYSNDQARRPENFGSSAI